jgi:hypothetical protein
LTRGDQELTIDVSSIRKKYFSDLERLHFAHAAAQNTSTSNTPRADNISTSSQSSPRNANFKFPLFTDDLASDHSQQQSTRSTTFPMIAKGGAEPLAVGGLANVKRRPSIGLKRPRTANPLGSESPEHYRADAASSWYESLPEKVRRQHLSNEEREAFGSGMDHIVNNLSRSNSRRNSKSSTYRLSQSMAGKALPLEPMDLSSNTSATQSQVSKTNNVRGNVKRAFTFSKPFHAAKSSVSSTVAMPTLPFAHSRDKSRAGTIGGTSRPSVDTTITAIDPDAMYYQSPEARSKLRQYLISPQKFDEALAFGFPSTPTTIDTPGLEEDGTHRKFSTTSTDTKTFLKDDTISLSDRPDDCLDALSNGTGGSDGDTDAPATPADPDWSWRTPRYPQNKRFSIFDAFDSDSLPSLDLKFQPELFGLPLRPSEGKPRPAQLQAQALPQGRASLVYNLPANSNSTSMLQLSSRVASPLASPNVNREMTLRMTLTRPDLRASEDELYGWQSPNQPKRRNLESRAGGYAPSMLSSSVDPMRLANLPEDVDDPMQSVFTKDPVNKSLGGSKVLFKRMMKRMRKT